MFCEDEKDQRMSSPHHNPEDHRYFLLEVFFLAKPQSAALEPTEEQQKEKLVEQSQTVWKEGILKEDKVGSDVKTYQNYEHRNILSRGTAPL